MARRSSSRSNIAPLPWETLFTTTPSSTAAAITVSSTSGPSTLGISIRKSAPSGNARGPSSAGNRRSSAASAFVRPLAAVGESLRAGRLDEVGVFALAAAGDARVPRERRSRGDRRREPPALDLRRHDLELPLPVTDRAALEVVAPLAR